MKKEFIGYGKTVEEARASAELGLNAPDTAEVKTEVVCLPKAKVLGIFGGKQASVKAYYEIKEPVQKNSKKKNNSKNNKNDKNSNKKPVDKKPQKQQQKSKPDQNDQNTSNNEKADVQKQSASSNDDKNNIPQSDIDKTKNYLESIIKGLKIEDAVISASTKDGNIYFEIECSEYGILIGHRGETLEAIQYLASISTKNSCSGYRRVIINVANYRERRDKTLEELARKNALYVQRTHKKYVFEPMNPYERRIIHTTVQEFEGIESYSIGSGADRKVIIVPQGSNNKQNDKHEQSQKNQQTTSKVSSTPRADRADLPKFGKIEKPSVTNE